MKTAQDVANKLLNGHSLVEGEVILDLDGYKIAVQSNSGALLDKLGIYFAHTLGTGPADCVVTAIECPATDLGLTFTDWTREPGKSGRKDAVADLEDCRLVHKVRTGMLFLQSTDHLIAAGPCLENDNQVINYINVQYINHLLQNGSLICHASGLVSNAKALAMAGFSGGGKSTLMLHILAQDGISYLTNDRLFINNGSAYGIPKLPRVNPGTMIHDKNLKSLLPPDRLRELEKLPQQQLWDIEEKYDVFIEDVYGPDKINHTGRMDAILILNWERESSAPCRIHEVDITERTELLQAIMKSPGPFYQLKDHSFFKGGMKLDEAPYLEVLKNIKIYEASGKVDFAFAKDYCLTHLLT
ncbi:HprK-related kinase B [Terasakiella sp. SH-1]|uniref:HprK-related kinase B n=1 Tax=Terasakiella sp. SH-1 TaxID=2560057 RepID=UPI0010737F69|nr:HprK-related kinase B [Terasakiella sp. SH-1]